MVLAPKTKLQRELSQEPPRSVCYLLVELQDKGATTGSRAQARMIAKRLTGLKMIMSKMIGTTTPKAASLWTSRM